MTDEHADPEKGTGAVMCCTFGDSADLDWWRTHDLPLIEAIQPDGTMAELTGELSGMPIDMARRTVKELLAEEGALISRKPTEQTIGIHERCDTPIEYINTGQWFVKLLEYKDKLLALADFVEWHPEHMKGRYISWVENLGWDWAISRQRYFGVTFPLWYCDDCVK